VNRIKLNKIALRSGGRRPEAAHPLQTTQWADFRREWGNEVLETDYGILTLHHIPFTKHKIGMFIRGPKPTKKMLLDLKNIANKNNLIFIKLEPNAVKENDITGKHVHVSYVSKKEYLSLIELMKSNNCVPGKTLFTPTSFQIDLTKSEEELLKSFHSKTRYNIKYAEKKGVKVVEDNSDKAFDKYIELTKETVERQGFYAHREKYHRLMWHHLHTQPTIHNTQPLAHLLTARYKGEIITTWVLFVWKDMLYYPYGASTDKYKNVQANSAMMWGAVKFGKKLGLKRFDLWGREEGKGFTRFKEGFNPQVVKYLGTWDLVINKPMYEFYKTAEKLRWTLLRTKAKLGLNKYSF
jgi:lipid II:glycine glycyltransferase (peptidoglycan interpeptide bridge formation enzyme)